MVNRILVRYGLLLMVTLSNVTISLRYGFDWLTVPPILLVLLLILLEWKGEKEV